MTPENINKSSVGNVVLVPGDANAASAVRFGCLHVLILQSFILPNIMPCKLWKHSTPLSPRLAHLGQAAHE